MHDIFIKAECARQGISPNDLLAELEIESLEGMSVTQLFEVAARLKVSPGELMGSGQGGHTVNGNHNHNINTDSTIKEMADTIKLLTDELIRKNRTA